MKFFRILFKIAGFIGYEVPSDWKEMEISISTDWWKGSRSGVVTFKALSGR